MARTLTLTIVILIAACEREQIQLLLDTGVPPPSKGDTIPGLLDLRVDPPSATITSDGVPPGETAAFRALGRFSEGERDVTGDVRWSISELGSIDRGLVTTAATAGGQATVRATAGGLEASAELIVRLEIVARDPDVAVELANGFPDDTSGDVSSGAVEIVYPAADTKFPSNMARIRHQWRSSLAAPIHEVRFESSLSRIRIYTRARSYELDESSNGWIPRTHAGRSITMTVRAIENAGSQIHRSEPRVLHFARSEIRGGALYWSSTARSIMRASLADPRSVRFLPSEGEACVACHIVSRDGSRIAAVFGGEDLRVFETSSLEALPFASDEQSSMFGSFSPDNQRLVVTRDGRLRFYDLATGESDDVDLPSGANAAHPDWSPDGRHVAFAWAPSQGDFDDKSVRGTSLAQLEIGDDGSAGTPEVLLASAGDNDTICFPSYSPDGKFIAFVRARGASKDNTSAEIHLIPSDGNSPPLLLAALNARIGNMLPTWATTTEPSIQWITFSSIRDYGDVVRGVGRDQLWGSAIDVDRIAAGSDPSSPAFWLPFQDPEEWNHRALWVPEAPPTPASCEPSQEICNGRDDDCDRVTDEGCGCGPVEICGNSVDDDCDLRTDSDDEDCP